MLNELDRREKAGAIDPAVVDSGARYFNRELSWLAFNQRVFARAGQLKAGGQSAEMYADPADVARPLVDPAQA